MGTFLTILSLVFILPSGTPDYRVFITKNRYEADLWVWKTERRYEAKNIEEFWCETNSKYQSNFTVRIVKTKYQSDLIVYFTDSKYQAGWKKNHKLKNILNVR